MRSSKFSLQKPIQPWLFLAPALLLMMVYLLYPFIETLRLSFYDHTGGSPVGWANYRWLAGDAQFWVAIRNNFLWLLIVPAACTGFGLVIAALADRVWWGTLAKSLVFMPMAISFVGASVIWKFVYDYQSASTDQIGLLNAVLATWGFAPQPWLTLPLWNNFFLMAILIWIQTGFALVVLAAALRGVPSDTLEAARVDGATPLQIFRQIVLPQIMPTVVVVWTTIMITVLKVFDIVIAMTGGQWDTSVLANLMCDWLFRGGGDAGRAATLAVILMLAVLPVWLLHLHRWRAERQA